MSTPTPSMPPSSDAALIEAYLDGSLPAAERAAFEARLRREAALRAEIDLQAGINRSLNRLFTIPEPSRAVLPLAPAPAAAARRWLPLAAAAAIALAAAGLWYLYSQGPSTTPAPPAPRVVAAAPTLREAYHSEIDSGFEPMAVCTTPDAFEGWVQKNYGAPLRPRETPESVQFVGWSYRRLISSYTGILLARVDGQPVIVVMDKAEFREHPPAEGDGGEHIFQKDVGGLVLYEVTPHPEPRILPLLELRS